MAGEEVEGWEGEEGSFREMNPGCAMGQGALAVVGIIQRWGLGGRSRGKSWPGDINANTYSEETLCQIGRSI